MTNEIQFEVLGRAVPKGSQRHVPSAKTGRPVLVKDPRLVAWESRIALMAATAADHQARSQDRLDVRFWPSHGPVSVEIVFGFERPKKHYRTGRFSTQLRDDAPDHPITRSQGDIDKLVRGVLDGITGPLIADDSQVRRIGAVKAFAPVDQCRVRVITEGRTG